MFPRSLLATLLLAGSLAVSATPPGAADSFQSLLDRAESIRSADPNQFRTLLGQLNARVDQATPVELQRLRYLKIYELGFTGRYDLAIEAASTLFHEVDDPGLKLRTGGLIVSSYASTRNFSEGLRYLDLTLQLVDRVSDPELRSYAWFPAATIYTQLGQYELSRHYAEQVLASSKVARTRCFAGQQRLEALFQLGELSGDDTEALGVVNECLGVNERLLANFARGVLARQWAQRGEHARAIELLESNFGEIEATRFPRLIGEIQSLLAELHFAQGRLDEAERYARLAIQRSSDIAFSLPLVQAHKILYESALQRGDNAAALDHLRKYTEADKAYLDSVKARELAFLMIKHETQQKNQTIELLNNQNRVLQLEQQISAKTAQANRLLIALLVLLVASVAYWGLKVKRLQMSFRRLAEVDALTGISNRLHFSRQAEQALEYCRKSGEGAALVMFDLDEFKSINDLHGHAMGDWVLQQVAVTCRSAGRKHDLFGRLGGEEFAFLLLSADLAAGTVLAQECRKRLAAIDTADTGARFRVTASFGVAATVDAGYDFHVLMAKADEAMYRSKRDGRDRVSVHAQNALDPRLA